MSSSEVELEALGGVAAAVAGRPVNLGGARQRTLLAALVVAYPYDVSAERLLEQVWHDSPDPKPGSLHVAISKLRDKLDPGRTRGAEGAVARTGTRYRLDVRPDQIDTIRFADLVARGDRLRADGSDAAADAYESALALWKGAPFADIADNAFVQSEITRLEAQELRTRKALIRIRIDRGDLDAAAEAAGQIATTHPLDESAWELRVLALYRGGRQSDALAALRRVRAILDTELGIAPGVRLRELETAVLRQDDTRLVGTAPAPATRPVSSNLTTPRTLLVGRVREIDDISRALDTRALTTLVGPGGVGKTRLAVEVCRRAAGTGGTWLVDLAAVQSETLVSPTIAATLQLSGPGTVEHLASALAESEYTVVMDNCEHVIDACAEVAAAILDRCPRVRILATSREPLGIDGEFVYHVDPLDVESAIDLFADRAAGAVPGWTLGSHDAATVRRICLELDGIPLGVELAAAQLRMLSEQQIADGLADRFALLRGGPRTAPERQRRMVDTIDWSYRLLDDDEARTLRQIAVFAGSFDIDGAVAVTESRSTLTPLEPLTALVRRSLLRVVSSSSPRRYRLLQTVRQFALDRMSDAERRRAEAAHRRFVLTRASTTAEHLRDAGAVHALAALTADVAEHRAAAESALAQSDPAYALELAGALYWFWYRKGHLCEGIGWLHRALTAVDGGAVTVDPLVLSAAHTGLGGLTYLTGDPAGAVDAVARAAELSDRAGDVTNAEWMRSWATYFRTLTEPGVDRSPEALACVDRLRSNGSPWQVAEALMIQGMILRCHGDSAGARPVLEEAVATAERCGHGWAVGSASWTLFRSSMDLDDVVAALAATRVMHTVLDSEGDVTSWLVLVHSISTLAVRLGFPADGAALLGAVQAHGSRIGFLPELMDPVDGPRDAATVRDALDPTEFAAHHVHGAAMTRQDVNALVWDLCERGRRLVGEHEPALSDR
ncbi:AfsR/SARP family transcriptional regulator [Prescottella agglutinans]|uniref:AfsR/SARP family transcriptional regulator n=1 Tax=Prescottella agglutinans TaxID=1644129 RepID=A0A3S3E8U2_9NOCA|nr:BTAD domain-containing putative transcriptional regulator [Prescottella agglutinans]RVW07964.1 AfsR/SARP family transcriptional regulator [Prescottella agglutinans]